ncbi:ComEC/Rec2 family competence protein [Candidatus Gracilibacteria bacterium]|nr:ComEC/Rec2 family competence protein [Candidatus Gracilibacteria bacterium]
MVRKIFNGANLFLFVLVIFVIINSLLSFSESKKSSPPIKKSFRVLSSNKDNFNQSIYFAKSGLEIFTITNPQVNLRIGSQYKIDALTKRYEYNSQNFNQSYFLSLGVTGQLELSKDSQLLVDQNCDWFCSILRRVDLLQKNIKKTYLNASCIEFAKINEFLNPKIKCQEVAALSSGLITGDTDGIEKSTNDNFKKLGLAHLVAVSGFQVVLLTSFLERILFKLSLPKYLRILLSVFSMLLLILLVGPQPPVLRSVMTLLIIYLALSLGRSVEYIRALIYSAIVLLFINPYYIYSISFQLSFLASFALGSNIFDQVDPTKFLIKFFKNLSSNILIFLFTLPILINLAGFVSPISIVVNLFGYQ